ncbi:MAG TPA: ATP-grasp domain-containing protein [Casimicrobiaceae bacterium]|nr:ATP-grasp domain-containing protein [Casimicrobiaceae bacterium]
MRRSILLVSTATSWLGTARMPRVLARAGFEVVLLAPQGSLAAKSRYVSRTGYLASTATPMEWLLRLIRMIEEHAPEALVPCDEMAVRLLITVALEPPLGFDPGLTARLVGLVEASLGDPRYYVASIDKTMLPAAAEAMGVRVPDYAIATSADDARRRARALGFPIVIKRRFGFAGQGVAVVASDEDLAAAAQQLLRPDQLDLGERRPPELLVQAFVAGPYHSQSLVAQRGAVLASFAHERYVPTAVIKGQTAVLRFIDSPETLAFSETLCRGLGMSGFFSIQFVLDAKSANAYLLEINRRLVTHMHLGERVGRDLATAFFDRSERSGRGAAATTKHDAEESGVIAVFPREWLRDPDSPYLVDFPVDVPWDDPPLLEAMLAMRHDP